MMGGGERTTFNTIHHYTSTLGGWMKIVWEKGGALRNRRMCVRDGQNRHEMGGIGVTTARTARLKSKRDSVRLKQKISMRPQRWQSVPDIIMHSGTAGRRSGEMRGGALTITTKPHKSCGPTSGPAADSKMTGSRGMTRRRRTSIGWAGSKHEDAGADSKGRACSVDARAYGSVRGGDVVASHVDVGVDVAPVLIDTAAEFERGGIWAAECRARREGRPHAVPP
ncbi:hypothetical protein B0H17DRAFT_1145876 [Mycena rosella]|uniref:Uncharacterized protein n=1 Tax=Mycena rosella TaxID=1033263 RepID=A0AAD7CQ57_MYCRO|nr:hypothetical protein B0H17DRAFT_1145876 [Mycena rosella]